LRLTEDRLCAKALREGIGCVPTKKKNWLCADEEEERVDRIDAEEPNVGSNEDRRIGTSEDRNEWTTDPAATRIEEEEEKHRAEC